MMLYDAICSYMMLNVHICAKVLWPLNHSDFDFILVPSIF